MNTAIIQVCFTATVLVFAASEVAAEISSPKVTLTQEEDGISVLVDGQLFTRYLVRSGSRPVLWPLIGPTGQPMTRAYPVSEARDGEATDHIHHRSMWVGYEGLNKVDYWHEYEAHESRPFAIGQIQHREFASITNGDAPEIVAKSDWLDDKGERVCSDVRTLQFGVDHDQRWIDYQIELTASAGPLTIGDSKEGVFALRVAHTMRVDAGLGGRIVSSAGHSDADAWAKKAHWVDYCGPVGDETLGIAILCHPSSYSPMPRWHVRTYGLFAANPFGEMAFTDPDSDVTKRPLSMTLSENESLLLRYRVILHRGDEKQAKIAEQFAAYAAP